jgi:protein-S-isoprenylcysteine O-methyltransferase Ste14
MSILHFVGVHFITLCWSSFVLVWIVAAFLVKPIAERQSWTGKAATFALLTLTFILLLGKIPWSGINARIWPLGRALRITGCTITFMGLVVSICSRLSLGANWSATVTYRQGHELVQRGLYRFVRHPMYTGFLLMIAGTGLVLGRMSSLSALIVAFLGTWWKLNKEETLLSKHFPDAYQRYKSHTKALIPFVL